MSANQGEARTDDPFDGLPLLIPVPRAAKFARHQPGGGLPLR